jgi:glycosyltransferase involved in cell wall biosynthesis
VHILFLSDNFPPEFNAPASRTFEHCREWVDLGMRVTVITCAPNFPKGEVFNGYQNRLWQREIVDGICVVRVWSYIAANEGHVKRILDYASFMVSSTIAGFFVRNVDIVIGTSPQFFTVCAAWALSKLKRVPWVFELRDIWPESIVAVGAMKNSFAIRILEKVESFLYLHATSIVVVTNAFKETLIKRGVEDKKIKVITNGIDSNSGIPKIKDQALVNELNLQNCFVAGYIGTLGMAHGLETLLEAAKYIQSNPAGENIRILFLGDGAEKKNLVLSAKSKGLANVLFFDSVQKNEVARYWSILNIAIIHLRKAELFSSVIPSKLFDSMGMGIPILHGVPGESAGIVVKEQLGEVFESENSEQLAKILLSLKSDPMCIDRYRKNCIDASKKYNRKSLAKNMLDILRGLVKK